MSQEFEIRRPEMTVEALQAHAEWLKSGRLDACETGGNIATRVLREDVEGTWEVPLIGGIDVVDEADRKDMERSGVDAVVLDPARSEFQHLGKPQVQVRWTGTDDQLRSAVADIERMQFIPHDTQA